MRQPIALVTGSSGFVGRHTARALLDRGYHVAGVDIRPGQFTAHVEDARMFLRRMGDRSRYDLVVHCAAVVGGRTMIDGEPLHLAVEDLTLDAELFRWALRARPGRIVAFSSSAAYPVHLQAEAAHFALFRDCPRLLNEADINHTNHIGAPDQTYGWVKLTLERLAAEANAEGIRTHVFRPFSGYGADQDDTYPFPAIMRRARDYARALPAARALGILKPFEVWGHPGSVRDWVHIDDVVACVLAHIDADVAGPVNICTGRATTFADLAHLALTAAGAPGPHMVTGDIGKPMGVFWRVGDPTLMQQVYTPRITIEEGVERAMKETAR